MTIDQEKVYYLAGPMRPLPEHNFPMFELVSTLLRKAGYTIISPHEMGDPSMTRGELMTEDLMAILLGAHGVITLPDWQISPGASAEVAVAFATEKPVYDFIFVRDLVSGGIRPKTTAVHQTHEDNSFIIAESRTVSSFVPREKQYAEGIPLVGLCGYAQSGKDTVAEHLVSAKGWTRVAFADALREILYALNPVADLAIRMRDLVDRDGWDAAKVEHNEVRDLLQRLGTEAGREVINQALWVRLGEEKIELAGGPVVITDCRFPNEVQMVRRRKGKLIWIDRPGVGAANAHASEHSVTADDCDYVLKNNGTLRDLYHNVSDLLTPSVYQAVSEVKRWESVNEPENALVASA